MQDTIVPNASPPPASQPVAGECREVVAELLLRDGVISADVLERGRRILGKMGSEATVPDPSLCLETTREAQVLGLNEIMLAELQVVLEGASAQAA